MKLNRLKAIAELTPKHHVGKTYRILASKQRYKVDTIVLLLLTHKDELAALGVEYAIETVSNASDSSIVDDIKYIYVGTTGLGIIAQCTIAIDTSVKWYECYSHGNYGKNIACGGNWSAKEEPKNALPEMLSNILNAITSTYTI